MKELDALQGFSIEKFQPRIIIVADYTSGTGDAVSKYLNSYGYLRADRTVMNDWYVRLENISFFRSKQIEVVRQHEEWQVHSLAASISVAAVSCYIPEILGAESYTNCNGEATTCSFHVSTKR